MGDFEAVVFFIHFMLIYLTVIYFCVFLTSGISGVVLREKGVKLMDITNRTCRGTPGNH